MPDTLRHDKFVGMRLPPLSLEALIGLFAGLFVGLVEMNWELRGLGVLCTAALAVHIAKRLDVGPLRKIGVASGAIAVLILGTYHPIWMSFHEDFPTVTGGTALSRIIMFCAVAVSCVAGYVFLIRPRGKEGYRVLPAQVKAFGACTMAAGFLAVLIGLGWQFQQDWTRGVTPVGGPVLSPLPPVRQITQEPTRALPPPSISEAATQPPASQYSDGYNLSSIGIAALADALYEAKKDLPATIDLQRTWPLPGFEMNPMALRGVGGYANGTCASMYGHVPFVF